MTRNTILLIAAVAALFASAVSAKNFKANWDSLAEHEAAPEWFQDAKLGIYFHWGPYSVPAFGSEWYPRYMFQPDSWVAKHHTKTYGPVSEFGYDKFVPMFTAEHFDPADWADLFELAGAKFAGPVAQHHDGFAMWDSKVNPWNAKDMGPKRDVLGELFGELKKRDLKTIATFHHARHGQRNRDDEKFWYNGADSHFPYHPDLPTATTDPLLRKLYGNFDTIEEFETYWLDQVNEVVDTYAPDIIWYDSWLNIISEEKRMEMAAHFFNSGNDLVMCHKQTDMPMNCSVLDFEQGGRREINQMPWMTDITLSKSSWCYVKGQKYKDPALVLRNMIDVWSKNGIVLLNISPRADGVIPDAQREVLAELGTWLTQYGEAVYATRPHDAFGEGTAKAADGKFGGQTATVKYTANDVRYTTAKDDSALYAIFLGQPEIGKRVKLHKLGPHHYPPRKQVKRVILLGTDIEVEWEDDKKDIYVTIPDAEMNELATVLKFELE